MSASKRTPNLPDRFDSVEPLASTPLERSFRAFDRVLQQDVIIRLPAARAWSHWSAPVRDRLLREARALAKVRHEAITPILWVEETDEGPLLVQPTAEGEQLTERLLHGPLGVDETKALGIGIAEALAAVHYSGIVHRGVGTDAVWLLTDGRARLGSFTFAKAFDSRLPSSIDHGRREDPRVAAVLPPYPAPEQLAGRGADPRVDVWALGCLMFRCLTGKDPANPGGAVPDVRTFRKDVPKPFGEVLRRCMHTAATARYPTANAVADALKALTQAGAGPGLSRRTMVSVAAGVVAVGAVGWWRPWAAPESDRSMHPAPGRVMPATAHYSDRYENAHVLLVGIAKAYARGPHAVLASPAREVEEIRKRLQANDPRLFGGDAIKMLVEEEASEAAIRAALDDIKRKAEPNDAVFVYFAGHGQRRQLSGNYWLVAADARQLEPTTGGFLERQDLHDLRDHCDAKHVLIALDCCYAGKLFKEPVVRGRTADIEDPGVDRSHASPYLRHRACQLMVSAGPSTVAKDDSGSGLSTFCAAFLEAIDPIENPDKKYVPVGAVWSLIQQRMPDDQKPPPIQSLAGNGEGTFVFFLPEKK